MVRSACGARCGRTRASSAVLMSRFSATASMTQSQSASLGRSSSKLPGVMSAASEGSKKAAGLDLRERIEGRRWASCGSVASGLWRKIEQERRGFRRWPDARRCGSPWFRRRERRRGGRATAFASSRWCGRLRPWLASAHNDSQYSILLGEAIHAAKLAHASSLKQLH